MIFLIKSWAKLGVFFLFPFFSSYGSSFEKLTPNILLILADDLGYGDLSCYNPEAKINTPRLDQLAKEGILFTDAHSPATVCTPTRYSLLTGRMSFRTGMEKVFTGVRGPCLIEEGRLTLPQMLREQGYSTACIGKWHIGMSFHDHEGNLITDGGIEGVKQIDYSHPIPDGPIHRGFDSFFGTVCCPTTSWLYAYIEGDRIPVPATKIIDKSNLPRHPYSHCRPGMIAEGFDVEEADMVFLEKSKEFLSNHVKSNQGKPFFLFHSMQAVHLPSFPADSYKGKTIAGPHGDFIYQMDDIVGQLLDTLEKLKVMENTLVIFASDNGPEVTNIVHMRKDYAHDGATPWRGMKRDQWEGGHRTPFIVRWPGKVKPGTTSDELLSLTDIMATCGAITGAKLQPNSAEDSYNMLPVLLGAERTQPIRQYLLTQTPTLKLAIRDGHWKYLDHKGSGGNHYHRWALKDHMKAFVLEEKDPGAPGQLYNLASDPGETINLYSKHPGRVSKLKKKLQDYVNSGRSASAWH